jgi:D-alanyl-D-alanine carboxypeptidase
MDQRSIRRSDYLRRLMRPRIAAAFSRLALVAALVLSLTTACGGPGRPPASPLTSRVAQQLVRSGAKTALVYVTDKDGSYESTAAQRGIPAPKYDQPFLIGSVTKTFTAVIVLQLAEEGKLRLDDPIERYLPGVFRGGNEITIRDLLRHQSGLANYTDYESWVDKAARNFNVHPPDIFRFAATKPTDFAPGKGWEYSNTNYIALGVIIERVTGNTFERELKRRILKPLGLRQTALPAAARLSAMAGAIVNLAVLWSAGGIVSDESDLAHFLSALFTGHLLSPSSMAEMKGTVDANSLMMGFGARDGLGIFSFPTDAETAGTPRQRLRLLRPCRRQP